MQKMLTKEDGQITGNSGLINRFDRRKKPTPDKAVPQGDKKGQKTQIPC